MNTLTYSEITAIIPDFNNLLAKLSIPYSQNDRIHQMANLLNEVDSNLSNEAKLRELLKANNQNGEIFYSLLELSELKEIMKYIYLWDQEVVKSKLIRILKGPLLVNSEDPNSNDARNTMFELRTASLLRSKGYKAVLVDPNPDVELQTENGKIFFQCKRLFSESNIDKNVSRARKQLIEDIRTSALPSHGVIAISISKLFQHDQDKKPNDFNKLRLLESTTEDSARKFLFMTLEKFIDDYKYLWQNISYKSIKAVLFHIACPMVITSKKMIYTASFWTMNNIHNDGSFEEITQYLERLQDL